MLPQNGFTVCLVLALVSSIRFPASNAQDIRLFGGSGGFEGRVEVRVNGRWGTVCNDTWDMKDAIVVCRELVNRTATMFTKMYGEGQGPILYSKVMCLGNEQRLKDCPREESSVDVCKHSQDAGVECGLKNEDLRLAGGSTPNEGRIEVYRDGLWGRLCAGPSWDQRESDVVCRTIGYPSGASKSSAGSFGNSSAIVFLVGLTCTGQEKNYKSCTDVIFTRFSACPTGVEDATVVCSLEPEVVTEQLSTGAIAGIGIGFGLVIVMCCIFSLNCKCRPFWKKREMDDTDVYQCNTASNADSKNYSTTSNLKSESENRNDSLSDIDPNLFVFAPKVTPVGFGGSSNDGTNGTLPNIQEANEPNGGVPVPEIKGDNKDESDVVEDVRLNVDEDVDDHDNDEKENVTIDMQYGAHFNKDNHDDELNDNPAHVNEDESSDQQAGDHESHDQSHDRPPDDLVTYPEGADFVSNPVAYDTRL